MARGRLRLAESISDFLSLGFRGCEIFRATEAEGPIPERSVAALTVMGPVRIFMCPRTEMQLGDTHAYNRNLSLQPKALNELLKGGQIVETLAD